jgi:hypothetical protein
MHPSDIFWQISLAVQWIVKYYWIGEFGRVMNAGITYPAGQLCLLE